MPNSAVLGALQRIAENGVETSVCSPQGGSQGHLRTEPPGSFSIKICVFFPLYLRLEPQSSFSYRTIAFECFAYSVRCRFHSGLIFKDFDQRTMLETMYGDDSIPPTVGSGSSSFDVKALEIYKTSSATTTDSMLIFSPF
jgi:hypothetical protein